MKLQSPEVWSNQNLASELGQKTREIKETITLFDNWDSILQDAQTAEELDDEELIKKRVNAHYLSLRNNWTNTMSKKMLSGEYDEADAFFVN